MSNDSGKKRADKKVIHLDEAERLPRASAFSAATDMAGEGRAHGLPAVPNSSQAAEVVKQIIEQILINERRRARIEFLQISAFFLVFLFAILGAGIWFARQLLVQLREERQFTEQTWRMMAGGGGGSGALATDLKIPPALDREEIAKIERDINSVSELLNTSPQRAPVAVQDMLQNQQNAIQVLSARLNEAQAGLDAASGRTRRVDSTAGGFIAAPLAEDLNLRMPIPSL